jgi:hypothetical protein
MVVPAQRKLPNVNPICTFWKVLVPDRRGLAEPAQRKLKNVNPIWTCWKVLVTGTQGLAGRAQRKLQNFNPIYCIPVEKCWFRSHEAYSWASTKKTQNFNPILTYWKVLVPGTPGQAEHAQRKLLNVLPNMYLLKMLVQGHVIKKKTTECFNTICHCWKMLVPGIRCQAEPP